jgi:hypothetical protein
MKLTKNFEYTCFSFVCARLASHQLAITSEMNELDCAFSRCSLLKGVMKLSVMKI